MKEFEFCERISDYIYEIDENTLVWCDEVFDGGVIALGWQKCNDAYISIEILKHYANMIFKKFPEINEIITHFADFQRM